MFYTEAYKERLEREKKLMSRWDKILNANGGIKNEHLARTTAILCENYLRELKKDPRLIAEDRIQSGAFKGINLALLGLITRVIPALVGAELVGVQAMPTPKSPVFTMTWHKDATKSFTTGNTATFPTPSNGDEMWVTPINKNAAFGGVDPYYTSNQVVEKTTKTALSGVAVYEFLWAKNLVKLGAKGYLIPESVVVYFMDSTDTTSEFPTWGSANYLARAYVTGTINGDEYEMKVTKTDGSDIALNASGLLSFESGMTAGAQSIKSNGNFDLVTNGVITKIEAATSKTVGNIFVEYQYDAEAEGTIPEISFKIGEESIGLIKRQLRGKYTMEALQDVKVLHGVNLDSELVNMMKNELMHEINHEILTDLRKMAATVKTLNFEDFTDVGSGALISGNYDDASKLAFDGANRLCGEIWVKGRLGYGNFIVGSPVTLGYFDRVPGFVGSGITYSGRDLSFAGSVGGKIKIYHDPTFPEDELLMGYKGSGVLETGYMHCPYLPITATPTLYDPNNGDPSKIFYTRYSKTVKENGIGLTKPKSVILNGEYQYARMLLSNFPGSNIFS